MTDKEKPHSSKSNETVLSDDEQARYPRRGTIYGWINVVVRKRNKDFIRTLIGINSVVVLFLSVIAIALAAFVTSMFNSAVHSSVKEVVTEELQVVTEELDKRLTEKVLDATTIAVENAVPVAVENAVAAAVENAVAAAVENAVAAAMPAAVENAATAAAENAVAAAVENAVPVAVENAVAAAAKATADAAAAAAVDAYQFDSEVAALNLRIQEIDRADGFSSVVAEEIISQIESLFSRADEQEFSKLGYALDTAVRNFAAADRLDFVGQLEDIAPDWSRNSVTLTITMVQALGLKLLGDAGAPASWKETTGLRFGTYERYRTYANRVELAGFPELYLVYEMLLGYIEGQPKMTINNLINDASYLNEADTASFREVMVALATERMVMRSTAESRRAAERVTEFLCEYKEEGDILGTVLQQAKVRCS